MKTWGIGSLCFLVGIAWGIFGGWLTWADHDPSPGELALSCLSAKLPDEPAPDPCFQIRELRRSLYGELQAIEAAVKLTGAVRNGVHELGALQQRIESRRPEEIGWVRRTFGKLWTRAEEQKRERQTGIGGSP